MITSMLTSKFDGERSFWGGVCEFNTLFWRNGSDLTISWH